MLQVVSQNVVGQLAKTAHIFYLSFPAHFWQTLSSDSFVCVCDRLPWPVHKHNQGRYALFT
jgi:hypothetical protein